MYYIGLQYILIRGGVCELVNCWFRTDMILLVLKLDWLIQYDNGAFTNVI